MAVNIFGTVYRLQCGIIYGSSQYVFNEKTSKHDLKNNFSSGISNAEGYGSKSASPYERIANMSHIFLMKT